MKLNKTMSGIAAPTASTPGVLGEIGANVNSVIVVGFEEFEVYGKLNGSWDQIGASITPEDDFDDFFDNTAHSFLSRSGTKLTTSPGQTAIDLTQYEDVYFVSTTGEQETMRYFFVEDAVVAPQILDGHQPNAMKLEDVSDVPSFGPEDAGKILSVDAQGNLAWITR